MDPLALAAGLLTITTIVCTIIDASLATPWWFRLVVVLMLAAAVFCITVNAGIALEHMLGASP